LVFIHVLQLRLNVNCCDAAISTLP
jgi:hypothetical protein